MSKRHKKLSETFNLPDLEDLNEDEEQEVDEDEGYMEDGHSDEDLHDKIDTLKKELEVFEGVGEITASNTKKYNEDIDTLYKTASDGYQEIFDAALAMEPSQGAKFLNGAAKLLEIALKSKNSSMEKQLDMAKLQLKREEMYNNKPRRTTDISDSDDAAGDAEDYGVGDNGHKIYDRNDLISQFNKKDDEE